MGAQRGAASPAGLYDASGRGRAVPAGRSSPGGSPQAGPSALGWRDYLLLVLLPPPAGGLHAQVLARIRSEFAWFGALTDRSFHRRLIVLRGAGHVQTLRRSSRTSWHRHHSRRTAAGDAALRAWFAPAAFPDESWLHFLLRVQCLQLHAPPGEALPLLADHFASVLRERLAAVTPTSMPPGIPPASQAAWRAVQLARVDVIGAQLAAVGRLGRAARSSGAQPAGYANPSQRAALAAELLAAHREPLGAQPAPRRRSGRSPRGASSRTAS